MLLGDRDRLMIYIRSRSRLSPPSLDNQYMAFLFFSRASSSGLRQKNDSLMMIYHHDLTIAVVELGPEKSLLGCELIEIK
uniref:Uncharacterized protein n=1 Tax=Phlebotomus papatasi TaxID=29031 RepID=A0A1B0D9R2_PHLPP